jgi:hypothetical protein
MTDGAVLPGKHDSATTKGTAASVVEFAKDPLLSAIADPLRASPSASHDLNMSTPERHFASHDLDVSRMGHLVSVDEFSSHTNHRPPQLPLHVYRDYSYATDATRVRVSHNEPPVKEQKVPPAQKQRVFATHDHQTRQMHPTDYHTITPSAHMQGKPKVGDKVESRCEDGRRHCDATRLSMINDKHYSIHYYDDNVEDTTTHSNQPTARMLTWEDQRVSSPGYLQVDDDQSLQTNTELWNQSEAKELNCIIQQGAVTPIHNGTMQIEHNKRSRHSNQRFHTLRNNYNEADFFTKQLPTPRYEQLRRNIQTPAIEVSKKSTTYATYPDRD